MEALEPRRLLAAIAVGNEPAGDVVEVSTSATGEFSTNVNFAPTSDAGSTLDTAADIGAMDGVRSFRGRLGWYDQSDVVRFSLDRPGDVEVELSDLTRNANVYLTDASGSLIDYSIETGLADDTVAVTLEAGEYWIAVTSTSLLTTHYTLTVSADLQPEFDRIGPSPEDGDEDNAGGVPVVSPLPDVAYYGSDREWNVNAVGAPESWAAGYTGQQVVVAVVDTGVDLDHPDLMQNLFVNPGEIPGNGLDDDQNGFVDDLHGYDFADGDNNPDDLRGHGTHVAGTIAAAANGYGATGIAPDATILPVRVLGADGSGSSNDVAAGIRYAAQMGADIINLSLGGNYSRSIDAAIEYASSLGSLVVAAAGNEAASLPGYPARFSSSNSSVISVGASSSNSALASFSNRVGDSGAVQVDAPGVGVFSTYLGGRYATLSGTSMASPHVAGLAALALSANTQLTGVQLRNLIVSGTREQASGSDSIGIANAAITVAYAAAGYTSSALPIGPVIGGASVVANSLGQAEATQRTTEAIDQYLATYQFEGNDRDDLIPERMHPAAETLVDQAGFVKSESHPQPIHHALRSIADILDVDVSGNDVSGDNDALAELSI
ncbi:S8 family serine peptidase [Rhodopirellula sallentina]|uniref:Peptidase S8 and S53, subtilisin, kexin, sedolisin domain protein n=1 Tax=Rhodopirellula sallentina SM41 TaxID=1263870 RepID=M5UGJ6_9BACT|nr:S8 family serine peptidase [Rhodopirellula sallentina]EMI56966.1 Peptidase S8 and S53, subtilisin, kexin, sedolisin domain protein [Rhodopirellula sallentina SM41]